MRQINNVTSQAYLEDRALANDILERNFYKFYRESHNRKTFSIYLYGKCAQQCEYCYIHNYHKDLFPDNLCDFDKIVFNTRKLLDWYKEQKFIANIDIFSAEFITTRLRQPIFDLLYEEFKDTEYKPQLLTIPDNMSWIENEVLVNEVEDFISKMASIDITVIFSASVDGKYCDYGRKEHADEFYDKLFKFLDKHGYLAHPMVSSHNVKDWIKNYDWWVENAPENVWRNLMTLEVRNPDWTDETIGYALDYYQHVLSHKISLFNINPESEDFLKNINDFFKYILRTVEDIDEIAKTGGLFSCVRFDYSDYSLDKIGCTINNALTFRVADLSIAPCHRQFYEELLIGYYSQDEDGNIIQFEPQNIPLLIAKTAMKKTTLPHCENCIYNRICMGFCLGASYEEYGNPFIPSRNVCNLHIAKNRFILFKLAEIGLFRLADEELRSYEIFDYLRNLYLACNGDPLNVEGDVEETDEPNK